MYVYVIMTTTNAWLPYQRTDISTLRGVIEDASPESTPIGRELFDLGRGTKVASSRRLIGESVDLGRQRVPHERPAPHYWLR